MSFNNTQLTIAIATTQNRFNSMSLLSLPEIENIVWRIYVQQHCASNLRSDFSERSDVTLIATSGTGASSNRNSAIYDANNTCEILLFSDDDISFQTKGINNLLNRFSELQDADFLCARLEDEGGNLRKAYPNDKTKVTKLNSGKLGTPELAIRLDSIREAKIEFEETFGAGKPKWFGDEFIFVCDALRKGLIGYHIDEVVGSHPTYSSGNIVSKEAEVIRRAVLIRALGFWKSMPIQGYYLFRFWQIKVIRIVRKIFYEISN